MAEIINLRLARKARKRVAAEATAAANRARFGDSKAATRIERDAAERRERLLDGARREEE